MKRFSSLDLDQELRNLQAYLRGPEPQRSHTAERLARLASLVQGRDFVGAEDVGTSDEDVMGDSEDKAIEILDKVMAPLGKKPYRWIPSHNFALNRALMAWNAWHFTVLPLLNARLRAYRPARNGKPEGIVLHPIWRPFNNTDWAVMTPDFAEKLVQIAKKAPSIKDSVKNELKWIETTFKIDIPSEVKNKIIAGSEKVAKRRIDVDRLRVKDELWPFDGSKPIPLGLFD